MLHVALRRVALLWGTSASRAPALTRKSSSWFRSHGLAQAFAGPSLGTGALLQGRPMGIGRRPRPPRGTIMGLGFGVRVQGLGPGALGRGPNRLERSFYIQRVATRSFAVRGPLVAPLWPFSLWQDAQRLSIGAKFCKRARLGATYYQPSLYH